MSKDLGQAAPALCLSKAGCVLVLITAFLGWMCAGWQLAISSLAMRVLFGVVGNYGVRLS